MITNDDVCALIAADRADRDDKLREFTVSRGSGWAGFSAHLSIEERVMNPSRVSRWVFVGTPGFLGRIDGLSRCAFWSEDPEDHGFDPAELIEVDLACTPSAAVAGEIPPDGVQVDDCFAGPNGAVGGTSLGPRWPELRLVGAVYLERGFVESLPVARRPACPPRGALGRPYECLTVVYRPGGDDPRAGRRYAGHHGEIVEERGSVAHVEVYPPGRSEEPYQRPVRMWIDLASAEHCDAGPDSLTTIGVGDGPKRGALFLINGQLALPDPPTSEQPCAPTVATTREPATPAAAEPSPAV